MGTRLKNPVSWATRPSRGWGKGEGGREVAAWRPEIGDALKASDEAIYRNKARLPYHRKRKILIEKFHQQYFSVVLNVTVN